MTIKFRRKLKGPRPGASNDLLVSLGAVGKHKPGRVLSLRLSQQVMKRARWISGDSIVADYDAPGTWRLQRVGDNTGNALKSSDHDKGRGAVRFTADDETISSLEMGPEANYSCSLCSIEGDTLVFQRD